MMALQSNVSERDARGGGGNALVESFGVLLEIEISRLGSLRIPTSATGTKEMRESTHLDLDELSLVPNLNILVLGLHLILLTLQLGPVRLNLTSEFRLLLANTRVSGVTIVKGNWTHPSRQISLMLPLDIVLLRIGPRTLPRSLLIECLDPTRNLIGFFPHLPETKVVLKVAQDRLSICERLVGGCDLGLVADEESLGIADDLVVLRELVNAFDESCFTSSTSVSTTTRSVERRGRTDRRLTT